MKTVDKINAMREVLVTIDPQTLEEPARSIALHMQMLRGVLAMVGVGDPLDMLVPDDPHEVDEFVDDAIRFLLNVRGDDLPPFSLEKYGEVTV